MAFQKVWWHTDENGRRIGYMDPVEFESILAGFYGDRGWVGRFAEEINVTPPTIYRYAQGENPIPKNIAMIVLMMAALGGPSEVPKIDAPWLPAPDAAA